MRAKDNPVFNLPDHRIFCDFKGCSIRPQACIVWPPGGGGNFISAQIAGGATVRAGSNEYSHPDGYWVSLDKSTSDAYRRYDRQALLAHLDSIYDMADAAKPGIAHRSMVPLVMKTHWLPYLTNQIYDIHAEEIIVISVGERCRRYIHLLELCKHRLVDEYSSSPHILWRVISDAIRTHREGTVNLDAAMNASYMLSKEFPAIPNMGCTPMAISWITENMKSGAALGIDGFLESVAPLFDVQDHFSTYDDEYSAEAIDRLRQHATAVRVVDYEELFIRLRIPTSGVLSSLSMDAMRTYTMRNLEEVGKAMLMMTGVQKDSVRELIDRFREIVTLA